MLYRCWWFIRRAPTPADAENEGYEHTHELVGHQEEYGGDGHHYEYHGSGDGGLAPARPRDLLRLGAHLLQEFKRTDLRHIAHLPPSRGAATTHCAVSGLVTEPDYAWQQSMDSQRPSPGLETGSLS